MTSTKGADAKNLSDSIIYIITKFNLEKNIVVFTCDDGDNLKKCSDIICSELDHTALFYPKNLFLQIELLVHVNYGACKACVIDG